MSTKSAEKTPKSTKKTITDDAEVDSGKSGSTRLNNDDKFEFLISCIRHSVNGKVKTLITQSRPRTDRHQIDFDKVAADCGVVSKGAAWVSSLSQISVPERRTQLTFSECQALRAHDEGPWHPRFQQSG